MLTAVHAPAQGDEEAAGDGSYHALNPSYDPATVRADGRSHATIFSAWRHGQLTRGSVCAVRKLQREDAQVARAAERGCHRLRARRRAAHPHPRQPGPRRHPGVHARHSGGKRGAPGGLANGLVCSALTPRACFFRNCAGECSHRPSVCDAALSGGNERAAAPPLSASRS